MLLRLSIIAISLAVMIWARAQLPVVPESPPAPEVAREWNARSESMHRILAGPIPGFWSDAAILKIFNTYDVARNTSGEARQRWWREIAYLLHESLALDPRFRDGLRLTEGLLGYEPGFEAEAVAMLERYGPGSESGEYLLVASFLAYEELHDAERAVRLAELAADKPDVGPLAQGFAAKILQKHRGCEAAIAFLKYRRSKMPEQYAAQIDARIKRLRQDPACLPASAAPSPAPS